MPASGSPIGLTPFGVGTPATAEAPPIGAPTFSRYINPGSGDLEIDDATGHFVGMPPIRQRVMIIFRTIRGSSTVLPRMGIPRTDKITGPGLSRLEQEIRTAFRPMVEVERVLRIVAITIEQVSTGRIQVTFTYDDLTNGTAGVVAEELI